jgi:hypothetical protein
MQPRHSVRNMGANMSKHADNRSKPIELSERQLDNVVGGTTSTPSLFAGCANGKHISIGRITCSK